MESESDANVMIGVSTSHSILCDFRLYPQLSPFSHRSFGKRGEGLDQSAAGEECEILDERDIDGDLCTFSDGGVYAYKFRFAEISQDFLYEDTLRLRVAVSFVEGEGAKYGWCFRHDVRTIFDLRDDMNGLFRDLESESDSSSFSDVTIEVDGVSLRARRAILSARSPVFRALFNNDMQESRTKHLKITDVDATTMKLFLEFLYAGDVCLELGES